MATDNEAECGLTQSNTERLHSLQGKVHRMRTRPQLGDGNWTVGSSVQKPHLEDRAEN